MRSLRPRKKMSVVQTSVRVRIRPGSSREAAGPCVAPSTGAGRSDIVFTDGQSGQSVFAFDAVYGAPQTWCIWQ